MKVRVTDDAKADLRQIKAFISEDKPMAAAGVIERIRKTITLLAVLPQLGHRGLVAGTFEKGVPACRISCREHLQQGVWTYVELFHHLCNVGGMAVFTRSAYSFYQSRVTRPGIRSWRLAHNIKTDTGKTMSTVSNAASPALEFWISVI